MRSASAVTFAAFAARALAASHTLFAGFFTGTNLVRLEFDDSTNALTLVENITAPGTSSQKWIALDSRKKNLYVATTGYLQSYTIEDDLSLTYTSNVSLSSNCTNANYISVSSVSPYTVFGVPFSTGCSSLAISVDDSGALKSLMATVDYDPGSGAHGSDISPDGDFFYSADYTGSGVWTHAVDETAGTVEEIQHLYTEDGSEPRHMTIHPNGKWVYVVYEGPSSIAVYSRDNSTGMLSFTNTTYSLLPDGFTNASSYWADEVLVSTKDSTSPKYLYAATRSRTKDIPGYVSAFSLDADTGAITEQLFLLPTTNSGGPSNSVGPAGFSEEYFVIPDAAANFLEVWKMADDASSAAAVAHLDLQSGPANAVWYS
ncbi:hypothetical protein KVR01_007375 [Diaporthe batatas]|uniref:uncharacterized protein n=1 Tax=Diaporthe batatas TaxID=748121 RepID=UPI001D03DBE3|nr:uncharacterized protein KVR01_007375 [Diaporthe batatas]KAG8162897.1 hypothetical protein KVR01_007375 [Diaporthe batatas]